MRLNNPMDGPHSAYPLIHRWTLTLLPPPGHSEWCWWVVVDTQSCLHRCHHSQCFLTPPSPGDLPSTGLSDDTNAQAPSSQASVKAMLTLCLPSVFIWGGACSKTSSRTILRKQVVGPRVPPCCASTNDTLSTRPLSGPEKSLSFLPEISGDLP